MTGLPEGSAFGLDEAEFENALFLMPWYGVIGIGDKQGDVRFIYDYEYNMKWLTAEIRKLDDELYVVNPALHVALG